MNGFFLFAGKGIFMSQAKKLCSAFLASHPYAVGFY